jgi:hypothetical protein
MQQNLVRSHPRKDASHIKNRTGLPPEGDTIISLHSRQDCYPAMGQRGEAHPPSPYDWLSQQAKKIGHTHVADPKNTKKLKKRLHTTYTRATLPK